MTRLLLFLATLPLAAQPLAVVNSADYTVRLAPGALISIFGANLQAPTLTVNTRPIPVFHTSDTQINAQLPVDLAPGPATLQVGAATLTIQIDAAAPAIFTPIAPTRPGELATIYLTGQGEVSPAVATGQPAPTDPPSRPTLPGTATIGGVPTTLQSATLAPGLIGVMQLVLRVPALQPGRYPLTVTMGTASTAVEIQIDAPPDTWPADLKASKTGTHAHASRAYASSSSLRIEWQPPAAAVHHYAIAAAERRSSTRSIAPGDARDATVRELKAGTEYSLTLLACLDQDCALALRAPDPAVATTEEEYWAIQGTGNSYAAAARLVPDGNVGSHAFRYGPWAGPELDGRVQLYYNPMQGDEKGAKIAEPVAGRPQTVEDALSFRGVSGFGLIRVCQPTPGSNGAVPAECANSRSLAVGLALYQAVPLDTANGAKIRLYFEAQGGDGRTRILYLDSQDGYLGRDFHPGAPTRCSTLADYSPGGACEPKLALGIDLDGEAGNPVVRNTRQFKIAYPTRDGAWDMKPGTAMWFTTEWQDGRCSRLGFNSAYAVWNGVRWSVAYEPDGCPKMLPGAQAPAVVHLGGARYKLYFNLHQTPGAPTDPRVSLKPMRMLYADPDATGDTGIADFEDWEALAAARQVHYLWPNGSLLTEDEESRLDDYVVLAPTADPERLVMYSNMSATGLNALPFIGSAVLVNP
jgi:uncharacterized protein (TIGR03437 family)